MYSEGTTAVFAIFILILIIVAIREFWTWYFKLNKIVDNQQKLFVEIKKQSQLFERLISIIEDPHENGLVVDDQEITNSESKIEKKLVRCLNCNWEGEFNELAIKKRFGTFKVCPNCDSGKWENK